MCLCVFTYRYLHAVVHICIHIVHVIKHTWDTHTQIDALTHSCRHNEVVSEK